MQYDAQGVEMNQRRDPQWQRVREIEEAGALLVRPVGVVAWRNADGTKLKYWLKPSSQSAQG